MKLQRLALTLLILMISFAGFSSTTTDLCQDSNHELVASFDDAQEVHGVADFVIVEQKSNDNTYTQLSKEINSAIKVENKVTVQGQYQILRRPLKPDIRSNKPIHYTHLSRLKAGQGNLIYRLARDGF